MAAVAGDSRIPTGRVACGMVRDVMKLLDLGLLVRVLLM